MNGEKQKFIGGINFEELRAQRVQLYNTIEIDLSIARVDAEHVFTGTYVYAMEATDVDANMNIRFNELFRSNINLVKGRGVRCPFYRFYLSNAAQVGKTLTLAIGIEAGDFEIFDVGKALGITGTVNVAQVGNLTRPVGSTQIVESLFLNNAITILHTVTVGKTFYLVTVSAQQIFDSASYSGMFVRDAADAKQYDLVYMFSALENQFFSTGLHFSPALEIPAGWDIVVESNNSAAKINGFISGYEV